MEETTKTLIEQVLKGDPQDIAFEPIPQENDSPLAQPVVQKNAQAATTVVSPPVVDRQEKAVNTDNQNKPADDTKTQTGTNTHQEPLDAPEQPINEFRDENQAMGAGKDGQPEFNMSADEAKLLANSILGMVNNTLLEVGAGYFVTIRKHQEFYDFEELIQVIDEQNVKNIKRMKLDEEDKVLLRPLLMMVLRRKTKVLSPEAQLLGVALSIIIKKGRIVMEIRAENDMLTERIRDMIRKELAGREEEEREEDEENTSAANEKQPAQEQVIYEESTQSKMVNNTGLPSSVLETTD